MNQFTKRLLCGVLVLYSVCSAAQPQTAYTAQSSAVRQAWQALLHMDSHGHSRVDSRDFFLAEAGTNNAQAEWQASRQAMLSQNEAGRQARCRFPARRQLLAQADSVLAAMPADDCPDYQHWRSRLQPKSITLVFASAYLGNPSSMFGHTFLRLDAGGNPLLSWAVNFAAQTADAKGLSFAWKGLTGGYPGRFGLAPYYDKVTEYARLEQRDLWEYPLKLDARDVDFLLKHLWEMRSVNFDYYFFQENCSFQLLALLQVLRPDLPLTDGFALFAAPVDTLRRLRNVGLLAEPDQRPALQAALRHRLAALPASSRAWLQQQLKQPQRALLEGGLPSQQVASTLDALADLADLRAQTASNVAPWQGLQQRALRLRSSYHQQQDQPQPDSGWRPDSGHLSQRASLGWRSLSKHSNQWQLGWRPVLHDALDGPRGLPPGSEISVLDMRISRDQHRWRWQQLSLFDVRALPVRDAWFTPWSWQLGVGYQRDAIAQTGWWQGRTALGGSWSVPGVPAAQTSLLATATLLLGQGGQRGVQSGLQWTAQGHWTQAWPWQLQLDWWRRDGRFEQRQPARAVMRLGQQWQISPQWALRAGWQQRLSHGGHSGTLQLLHYF